jgi:hypothetical protein
MTEILFLFLFFNTLGETPLFRVESLLNDRLFLKYLKNEPI